jgi:predicted ABC-type ATPase
MTSSLYIIAGPNGAGKTTFAQRFLPFYADCKNFVNADLIAQGVSPLSPESAAFRAGRLVLEQIHLLARRRADFGLESTLSGRSYLHLIRGLQRQGYSAHIFFLWIPSVEVAISRVHARVSGGGHDVPEAVVRRRFHRSVSNFLRSYRGLVDSWMLFDNSAAIPTLIAFKEGSRFSIINAGLYGALEERYRTR